MCDDVLSRFLRLGRERGFESLKVTLTSFCVEESVQDVGSQNRMGIEQLEDPRLPVFASRVFGGDFIHEGPDDATILQYEGNLSRESLCVKQLFTRRAVFGFVHD